MTGNFIGLARMNMNGVFAVCDVIEKEMFLGESAGMAVSGTGSVRVDTWKFQHETMLVVWSKGCISYVSSMNDSVLDSALGGAKWA
jgi:hypothetical protein